MNEDGMMDFVRDMFGEMDPGEDPEEARIMDALRGPYMYYSACMKLGFPEERAFQLTMLMLTTALTKANGGEKK